MSYQNKLRSSYKIMNPKYEEIWENRYNLIPNTKNWKPFSGWKNDEDKKHLVLIVLIKDPEVTKKFEDVQNELCKHKSYIRFPKENYHITLKPIGYLNEVKSNQDDYSEIELNEIITELTNIFSNQEKIEVKLNSLNLFKDVVFIQVDDNDIFSKINKKILNIPKIIPLKRDYPNFLPHISMGTFKSDSISNLIKSTERYRNYYFGKIVVDEIQLAIAHWYKTKYLKFEVIKKFKLE